MTTVAAQSGHTVVAHGEAPLSELGVRPDYAIRVDGAITGYLEVKRPDAGIDPASFRGHNKLQWQQLRDLPDLIYTNGNEWRLYRHGELSTLAKLSGNLRSAGAELAIVDEAFEGLIKGFLLWAPRPITSVRQLVTDVAPLCRLLRSSVLDQLAAERKAVQAGADEWEQPFTGLARDWRNLLFPTASDETFADGYAQTLTFALLLARTENIDFSEDTSMYQIAERLRVGQSHALMSKALELLTGSATEQLKVTLDLLERVIGAVDWGPIRDVSNVAYLHLYESFLEVYDPRLREDSGTYYTPYQVVDAMVRLTDDVLRTRLDTSTGFLAPAVTAVDPAMGTGTFLNAIIERAASQTADADGPGAVPQAITALAARLIGFEQQMGSYAVAEMRVADLLKTYNATAPADGMRLYVTNTLDDPYVEQTQIAATYAPLARSRRRANEVKAHTPVTVVIGNPPYDERAQGKGSWVETGGHGTPAPLDRFREGGNGRLEYVLKSFYVYFYAWATWKVFDANPGHRHGIVTFITTAGYLKGPGFRGMRRYLRKTCSEGWIINVSPEGMQPDVATRLFPTVQQPLAIAIFARRADTDPNVPADLHYTEVTGRRQAKYAQLAQLSLDGPLWRPVRTDWDAPFTPAANSGWDTYPALSDLMPWSAAGVKPNRTWIYAPSAAILQERWNRLVAEDNLERKRELFKESRDRKVDTRVGALPGRSAPSTTIADDMGPCLVPERVAYRSFDRQWIIPDNRLLHGPSPDLWRAATVPSQLFLVEQRSEPINSGPGVVFTTLIPDMDYFKGSEGGRVLPILHPDGSPNLAPGLLTQLGQRLGMAVTEKDLVAYVAAVTAHPGFTTRFADELMTPGIRVPLTVDADIFTTAVIVGRELIWAATYGAAFADPEQGRPLGLIAYSATDPRRVQNLTTIGTAMPERITYDQVGQRIHVGNGSFGPVPDEVWSYDVGGMKIVKHWFDYRKAEPSGRRSSPLDDINANEWPIEWIHEFNELLTALRRVTELEPQQKELLNQIVEGPTVTRADLAAEGVRFPASGRDRRPRYSLQPPTSDQQTLM
ncbi:MAG: type ISP restriction/modification enzyme [Streptosporangiaceae bacterium]